MELKEATQHVHGEDYMLWHGQPTADKLALLFTSMVAIFLSLLFI